jgi:hypothetical protein
MKLSSGRVWVGLRTESLQAALLPAVEKWTTCGWVSLSLLSSGSAREDGTYGLKLGPSSAWPLDVHQSG